MDLRFVILASVCVLAQCEVINLSCKQIRSIVDGHNTRREMLVQGKVKKQPAATNMTLLVWDEELAKKAADWVARDIFEHNPDRTIGSGRFTVNDNSYFIWSTETSLKLELNKVLSTWFQENKVYTFGPLKASDITQAGRYLQMVWADSIYLGCGASKTKRNEFTVYFMVCYYGPGGNFLDVEPYSTKGDKKEELTCEQEYCKQKYGPNCSV